MNKFDELCERYLLSDKLRKDLRQSLLEDETFKSELKQKRLESVAKTL